MCDTRLGLLSNKSWVRTEDCGHLVIVTTHITNIWIKKTTVNTRQTRNGKLDGFERRVSPLRLSGASFFHDVVYQVCQIDFTSRTM